MHRWLCAAGLRLVGDNRSCEVLVRRTSILLLFMHCGISRCFSADNVYRRQTLPVRVFQACVVGCGELLVDQRDDIGWAGDGTALSRPHTTSQPVVDNSSCDVTLCQPKYGNPVSQYVFFVGRCNAIR